MQDGWRKLAGNQKWPTTMVIGMLMVFAVAPLSVAEEQVPSPDQPPLVAAANPDKCSELVTLLAEQEQKNSKEFRQIKRDIAALSQQVSEPGMREIFGGIGYILGIFGVAAYFASRKKTDRGGC